MLLLFNMIVGTVNWPSSNSMQTVTTVISLSPLFLYLTLPSLKGLLLSIPFPPYLQLPVSPLPPIAMLDLHHLCHFQVLTILHCSQMNSLIFPGTWKLLILQNGDCGMPVTILQQYITGSAMPLTSMVPSIIGLRISVKSGVYWSTKGWQNLITGYFLPTRGSEWASVH